MYKPIQIAEILYHDRIVERLNLLDIESYRNKSKRWRDEVCLSLIGQVSTSSAKFQDNLFENNALLPELINILGEENRRANGAVEAYIYRCFATKYSQLSGALSHCLNATKDDFDVLRFIDSFRNESGLRRSIDKVYEIIVYALFSTLVAALELKVEVSVNAEKTDILREFEDFARLVMNLDFSNPVYIQDAKIYRVGVTNAADRGLDMYSNWGPAIQIKHLSLDEELAENIVANISSDRIVIVCKDAEQGVIVSLLTQIGWKSHIQSIVTESNLVDWYEKALRGHYSETTGAELIGRLCEEIANEFPSLYDMPEILKSRNYDSVSSDFWT
jgi:type II restriction enzyme